RSSERSGSEERARPGRRRRAGRGARARAGMPRAWGGSMRRQGKSGPAAAASGGARGRGFVVRAAHRLRADLPERRAGAAQLRGAQHLRGGEPGQPGLRAPQAGRRPRRRRDRPAAPARAGGAPVRHRAPGRSLQRARHLQPGRRLRAHRPRAVRRQPARPPGPAAQAAQPEGPGGGEARPALRPRQVQGPPRPGLLRPARRSALPRAGAQLLGRRGRASPPRGRPPPRRAPRPPPGGRLGLRPGGRLGLRRGPPRPPPRAASASAAGRLGLRRAPPRPPPGPAGARLRLAAPDRTCQGRTGLLCRQNRRKNGTSMIRLKTGLPVLLALAALAASPGGADAKKKKRGKAGAPACGLAFLPLVEGAEWTYEHFVPPEVEIKPGSLHQNPPDVVKIKVLKVEDDGSKTRITVEESWRKVTVQNQLVCTDKSLQVPPTSFFFAGAPGGGVGI